MKKKVIFKDTSNNWYWSQVFNKNVGGYQSYSMFEITFSINFLILRIKVNIFLRWKRCTDAALQGVANGIEGLISNGTYLVRFSLNLDK